MVTLRRLLLTGSLSLLAVTDLGGILASEAAARRRDDDDDRGGRGRGGRARSVPELDPNAAGQAVLLVLGGAALALGRRRTSSEA